MFESLFDLYSYPFWILIIALTVGAITIISRPFSTYVKFVYPNAKFEAMGNPFIGGKELDSVAESKDIISFKETINTLKDYNISGDDTSSVQRSLDDNFIETVNMMQKDSSKKMNDFYDVYFEKIDVYLIKNMLKRKIEGKNIEEKKPDEAILPKTKKFLQKIIDADKNDLPSILKNYGFNEELTLAVTDERPDFLTIDTDIDKYIINRFKQTKVPYKCEQGKQKFVKTMVDIINVKNILRAKQLGYNVESCQKMFIGEGREIAPWKHKELSELDSVSQVISGLEATSYYDPLKNAIEDYNQEKSVQVFEIALDQLFLRLVRDISMQNYISIGPTIRFLISKEFEIRNLKIIAKGVSENLPVNIIKSFLVKEAT